MTWMEHSNNSTKHRVAADVANQGIYSEQIDGGGAKGRPCRAAIEHRTGQPIV
jgi:hypothetical protein